MSAYAEAEFNARGIVINGVKIDATILYRALGRITESDHMDDPLMHFGELAIRDLIAIADEIDAI